MMLLSDRIPIEVKTVLQQVELLHVTEHAGRAHYEITDFLTAEGFFVECEHPIYFADGTQERIDLVAHRDNFIIAMEIDAKYKGRSVVRLRRLKGGETYLVLVLLQSTLKELPEGIDAVVVPAVGRKGDNAHEVRSRNDTQSKAN